jgi:hypothetical protein
MKHFATPKFWHAYRRLPGEVQKLANDCYDLLKQNPRHPSLHFKRIGPYRSARVGLHHRALAVPSAHHAIWFWIGTHAEYDRILKTQG